MIEHNDGSFTLSEVELTRALGQTLEVRRMTDEERVLRNMSEGELCVLYEAIQNSLDGMNFNPKTGCQRVDLDHLEYLKFVEKELDARSRGVKKGLVVDCIWPENLLP